MNHRGGSSGKSGGSNLLALAERWEREAFDLERMRKSTGEYTLAERRLLEMHARAKRGCAQELKLELAKG